VDVERAHVRPLELALNQPERVRARRGRGPHVDDATAASGNDDAFGVHRTPAQHRHVKVDEAIAHGNVDATGEGEAGARAAHHDLALCVVAGHDRVVLKREVHLVGLSPQHEGRGEQQQHECHTGADQELSPAKEQSQRKTDDRPQHYKPTGRRDEGGQHRPGPGDDVASGPRKAQRSHTGRNEPSARVAHIFGAGLRGGMRLPGCLGPGVGEGAWAHSRSLWLGGGVSRRIWPITAVAVTPSNSASGSRMRRWASTASASVLTSSGVT